MRRLRPNSRHDVPLDNLACAFKDGIDTVVQGHVIKVLAAKAYMYGRDYPTKFFAYMLDFLSQ